MFRCSGECWWLSGVLRCVKCPMWFFL
uniref:Uncharacterized protein n=1 Tax=Anguilla anguilla TaxID=7936 RepID=A0A0E9UV52_ANGAN